MNLPAPSKAYKRRRLATDALEENGLIIKAPLNKDM